ncbi:hypothetical protein ASG17_07780 [Brevundimonas sp. Leaf363]|nr:hypothetical protein ASG17_07780 [Brevundimonas sp. Leaf363]
MKVMTAAAWGRRREKHHYADNILFSGPEANAKALVERLTSSAGLMKDEVRRSRERHAARVAAEVARATQPEAGSE